MQVTGLQLKKFLKYLDLTQDEASKRLNVSRQTINTWCKLAYLDEVTVQNVKTTFVSFDNWLKNDGGVLQEIAIEYRTGVPYFEDLDVTASVVTAFQDYKELPTFYINYKHFNDCDAYVPVMGDSMEPKYCNGEIIAIRKINNIDALLPGEAYLVITSAEANSLRTIKCVFKSLDVSKIILRAINPNYAGDTEIYKKDVLSIYFVKGKISRNEL